MLRISQLEKLLSFVVWCASSFVKTAGMWLAFKRFTFHVTHRHVCCQPLYSFPGKHLYSTGPFILIHPWLPGVCTSRPTQNALIPCTDVCCFRVNKSFYNCSDRCCHSLKDCGVELQCTWFLLKKTAIRFLNIIFSYLLQQIFFTGLDLFHFYNWTFLG